jgi:hypothetical protein
MNAARSSPGLLPRGLRSLAGLFLLILLSATPSIAQTAFTVQGADASAPTVVIPDLFTVEGSYVIKGENLKVTINKITLGPKLAGAQLKYAAVVAGPLAKGVFGPNIITKPSHGVIRPTNQVTTFSMKDVLANLKEIRSGRVAPLPMAVIRVDLIWDEKSGIAGAKQTVTIPIKEIE